MAPAKRWGTLRDLTHNYPVKKTVAYKLLGEGKLRAKKLNGRTVWDLASAEELFESLPDYQDAA